MPSRSSRRRRTRPATKNDKHGIALRRQLFNALKIDAKKAQAKLEEYSRQIKYDDVFSTLYSNATGPQILEPPYLPGKMYELYEESAVLQACVETYVRNIVGYGWKIVPEKEGDDPEVGESREKSDLEQVFKQPNPDESMNGLAEKFERDFEVTGNAYIEVVRTRDGMPTLFFWMDARRTRLLSLGDLVDVQVKIARRGQEIDVPMQRHFRGYVMIAGNDPKKRRYFKEFGDPRTMDAMTGIYVTEEKLKEMSQEDADKIVPATEVIHMKNGNGTYGIPRWIGALLTVMGVSRAEYVNYDLFDGQGIPPLIVSLAGGTLTDDSLRDLMYLLQRAKGIENFNKILLLEAESTTVSMDGKETAPKLEVKSMTDYRKEDAMFLNYLEDGRKLIRQYGFRLPSLYLGDSDAYRNETARIARETAEEQIFVPERRAFEELVNSRIVKSLGATKYVFRCVAPVIKVNEDLVDLLPTLTSSAMFTVNTLIGFVNEHFGTNLVEYKEEWAKLPIPKALAEMKMEVMSKVAGLEGAGKEGSQKSVETVKRGMSILGALVELDKIVDEHCPADSKNTRILESAAA